MVLAGSAVILLCVYYFFFFSPALEKKRTLTGYVQNKEADLSAMLQLTREWDAFKEKRLKIERQLETDTGEFSLLSFLEGIARQEGIDQNIQYMKPLSVTRESDPVEIEGMEMNLQRIRMEALVPFLDRIENADRLLNIRKIKISRHAEDSSVFLEVTLQVHCYSARS